MSNNSQRLEAMLVREPELDHLIKQIDQLDPESKSLLVRRILGDRLINVTFGGNVLNAPVVVQVNAYDKDAIASILETIADKLTRT